MSAIDQRYRNQREKFTDVQLNQNYRSDAVGNTVSNEILKIDQKINQYNEMELEKKVQQDINLKSHFIEKEFKTLEVLQDKITNEIDKTTQAIQENFCGIKTEEHNNINEIKTKMDNIYNKEIENLRNIYIDKETTQVRNSEKAKDKINTISSRYNELVVNTNKSIENLESDLNIRQKEFEDEIVAERTVREKVNGALYSMIEVEQKRLEDMINEEKQERLARKNGLSQLFKDICNRIVKFENN